AAQHVGAIVGVSRAVQVRMRIDQQLGISSNKTRSGRALPAGPSTSILRDAAKRQPQMCSGGRHDPSAVPYGLAATTVYPSGSRIQHSQWFGPPSPSVGL